ncbi:MAG: transposase [Verrucomicrobiales bacterium]|nr:transposase [Verrucomicrobiales bacterium]
MSFENLTSFKALVRLTLKTSRAWEIKERFGGFWELSGALQGAEYFAKCHRRTQRCRLEPMKQLWRRFKASQLQCLVSSSKPNGLEPGQVEWGDLIGWERCTVAGWSQAPRWRCIRRGLGSLCVSIRVHWALRIAVFGDSQGFALFRALCGGIVVESWASPAIRVARGKAGLGAQKSRHPGVVARAVLCPRFSA